MAQGRSVNKEKSVVSSNAVCSLEPLRFERRVMHSPRLGAHVRRGAALLRDARREDHRRRSVHRDGPSSTWSFQLIRRRSRAGVVEMVNLSAHRSSATDKGSQRDHCALAALPKQRRGEVARPHHVSSSAAPTAREAFRIPLWAAQTGMFPARSLSYRTL
jgi:hypothetical protein